MNEHTIGIDTAIAITGLSKRTLWRRISEGLCRNAAGDGARAMLVVGDVLDLANLTLDENGCRQLAAADAGDRSAQLATGLRFAHVGKPAIATYWFELAAAQDDADAMHWLGLCHATGEGVPHDDNLALMWIARAAANGHAIAQLQMTQLQ